MSSRRWCRCAFRVVFACAFLAALAACGGPSPDAYAGYLGPEPAPGEIVTLRLGDADWVRIESPGIPYGDLLVHDTDYEAIELLSGWYRIAWGKTFAFSALVKTGVFSEYAGRESVMLARGHVYTLRADRTHGHGYRIYFWIKDDTTSTVVAGDAMP